MAAVGMLELGLSRALRSCWSDLAPPIPVLGLGRQVEEAAIAIACASA